MSNISQSITDELLLAASQVVPNTNVPTDSLKRIIRILQYCYAAQRNDESWMTCNATQNIFRLVWVTSWQASGSLDAEIVRDRRTIIYRSPAFDVQPIMDLSQIFPHHHNGCRNSTNLILYA